MKIEKRGGYRPNAGRPKGAKNLTNLPKKAILEYTSPQELGNMVQRAKKWAKTDKNMLRWYLEMVFGKPKTIEREGGAKTVNNIAYFLDNLEREAIEGPKPDYFIGDIPNVYTTSQTGQETAGQDVETSTFIYNQGQEPEQNPVQAEQGSGAL